MKTKPIAKMLTKPLNQAIEVKETIKHPALIPDAEFEEINQIIERKAYDLKSNKSEGQEQIIIDFGNGYNTEFIISYRASKFDPETNEVLEYDHDDKTIEGGDIFKGGEITGDKVDFERFYFK